MFQHLPFLRHGLPAIVLCALAGIATAQPGANDPTFNPGDMAGVNGNGPSANVRSMVLQPDGKILVGGEFGNYNGTVRNRIARLNSDGNLDNAFDPGTGVAGGGSIIHSMALQPDGKVLIAGSFTSYNGTGRNNIARLNSDGSLDTGFDPGTGASGGTIDGLALQADGKVLIAGQFTSYNGTDRNRIARLNADGSLDTGFDPGTGASSAISSIVLQTDGKILVGGAFTTYNTTGRNRIARLNTDGSLDASFDPGTGVEGGAFPVVNAVAVQPDGGILIGGSFTTYNGTGRNNIARVHSDGSMDTGFNPGTGADGSVLAMALQPDGKVVIGGQFTSYAGIGRNLIARVNGNGGLDASFDPGTGVDGGVLPFIYVRTLALQPDGKIHLGGNFTGYGGTPRWHMVRLNTNGSLDTGFNPGTGANWNIRAIAVQTDGKVIIGGEFTSYNGTPRNRIARLNADGSLDTGFDPGTGANNTIRSIALQPDGRILVGGSFTSYNATGRNRIARLNSDGSLDNTFNPGTGADGDVLAVALQPDGKALIGGSFTSCNGTGRGRIARLNGDGGLDPGFDPGSGADDIVRSIALQADGKALIGGSFTSYNATGRNRIARLNADGGLDTGFDPGSGASGTAVMSIALQADGKVLIGGEFTTYNGTGRIRIARLNADGGLDTGFDPGTGANSDISSTMVQADGKIIIGGNFLLYDGTNRARIARLNGNGTLDTGFDPGTGSSGTILSMALQPDGRVLIGGSLTSYNGTGRNRIARIFGAPPDCNGDPGGTAFLDNCNACVGGNTGFTPCVQDCHGDWGGTASIDPCGECAGGNTGITPCTPGVGDYLSATTGNWATPATWVRYDGVSFVPAVTAPTASDGTITIRAGHTVTASTNITADQVLVKAGGTLAISGGTFTAANGPGSDVEVLGSLLFSGGAITGPGTVDVAGTFGWTGGSILNSGILHLAAGSTTTFNPGSVTLNNEGTINHAGTWTMLSGNLWRSFGSVGAFNNLPTGVVHLNGWADNTAAWAQHTNNQGVFNKNGAGVFALRFGGGGFTTNCSFTNNGTVNVAQGEIFNNTSNAFTNNGAMVFGGVGTVLRSTSLFDHNSGASITGLEHLIAQAANFNVNAGSSTSDLPQVTINGGTLTFNQAVNATTALNLSSGMLTGSMGLTLLGGGAFTWTGGMIGNNGFLHLAAGSTTTFDPGSVTLNNEGTINNAGTWTMLNGNLWRSFGSVGAFNNLPTGVVNVNGWWDNTASWAQHTNNQGIFNKNGAGAFAFRFGGGGFTTNCSFTNNGTVNVVQGELFNNTNNTFANNGTIIFGGTGTSLRSTALFNHNSGGSITGLEHLIAQGSDVNLNAGSSTSDLPLVTINGGTLRCNQGVNATTTVNFTSGVLTGSADLTVLSGGHLAWTGGSNNGLLHLAAGSTTTFNPGNATLTNEGTINNAGTWTMLSGNLWRSFGSVGAFNNLPTGVVNANGWWDNTASWAQHTNNQGTFNKNGAGTFAFRFGGGGFTTNCSFTNNGTVNVVQGELFNNTNNTFTNQGLLDLHDNTSMTSVALPVQSGVIRLGTGAVLTSTVPLNFAGTGITNNGSITTASVVFQGGTNQALDGTGTITNLTINNPAGVTMTSGAQTVGNTLTLTNGKVTLADADLIVNNPAVAGLAGGSVSSHVVTSGTGSFQREVGSGSRLFPVGTATSYLPAMVNLTAGPQERFGARVQEGVHSDYGAPGVPAGPAITGDHVERTWVVTEAVPGGNTADITLQWNATDEGTGFDRANCGVFRYDGTDWTASPFGAASGGGPYTRTLSGLSIFREFTVADAESMLLCPITYYLDNDGDGYGDPSTEATGCPQPPNTVLVGGDCDDGNASIHPAAAEVCDGLDNNCDGTVDNFPQPPSELGLVGHWRFDNGMLDATANANHGVGGGGVAFTTGMGGTPNGALVFDGVNDHVDIPNHVSYAFGTGNFTISYWFNTVSGQLGNILNKCGSGNSASSPWPGLSSYYATGQISARTQLNASVISSPLALDDGEWHHVAFTRDGSLLSLYIDGTVQASGSFTPDNVTTGFPIVLGRNQESNQYNYNGKLDNLRLYGRALDAAEVQVLRAYELAPASFGPPAEVCNGLDDDCDGLVDEGFPDTDADGMADCVDGCPNDPQKTTPGSCGCGNPEPGTFCDVDPGPGHFLGQIDGTCTCVPTCTTDLFFVYNVGNNPDVVTWSIHQSGTNALVQSGTVPCSNCNGSMPTCLPDGSFYLRVTDGNGDGMAGGYRLITADGKRIIDNTGNFNAGGVSMIADSTGVDLPIGSDQVIYTSCDKLWWRSGDHVVANENTTVSAVWLPGQPNSAQSANSGYEFWWYDPNGGYSFRKLRAHALGEGYANIGATRACHQKLDNWAAANHLPQNRLLNVRVRGWVNGVPVANWGPACRFAIDEALAACQPTKLMDIPGDADLSCGATRSLARGQRVVARPVRGANAYQWRFRLPAELFTQTVTTTTYILNMGTVPGLANGKTYNVEVRASMDGGATWCGTADSWGDVCLLTIAQPMQGENEQGIVDAGSGFRLWPNPNRGDRLSLRIDVLDEGVGSIAVDVYDLSGKRIVARVLPVQGDHLNTVIGLDGALAAGMYVVQVIAGNRVFTERLVVQP